MPTIKLVVVGSSGVGKTSLRGKFVSGRYSAAYRATIGADFITKTLPHPHDPQQSVTLQIWDTAGQERFSSLSSAFFRGADAVLLMFDVNTPETMHQLSRWWTDFCSKAPVSDGPAMEEFPCVVVGNKVDMISSSSPFVTESEALVFLDELVPSMSPSPITGREAPHSSASIPTLPPSSLPLPPKAISTSYAEADEAEMAEPTGSVISQQKLRSNSIDIPSSSSLERSSVDSHQLMKSRSRSSSRFYSGTMTTTHTTLTIYHTPSSSFFDSYNSAQSSFGPVPASLSAPVLAPGSIQGSSGGRESPESEAQSRQRRMTMQSTASGSTSSGSAVTITPSLIAREKAARAASDLHSNGSDIDSSPVISPRFPFSLPELPIPPDRGPKLFFTSAKTGEGVTEVFEYVAKRVLRKWDYDEAVEARKLHFRETSRSFGSASGMAADTIRLGLGLNASGSRSGFFGDGKKMTCCS